MSSATETLIWEPDSLADALEGGLPAGLRLLADALDRGEMTGHYLGSGPFGFGCRNDEMGLDVVLRLRIPLRQVRALSLP